MARPSGAEEIRELIAAEVRAPPTICTLVRAGSPLTAHQGRTARNVVCWSVPPESADAEEDGDEGFTLVSRGNGRHAKGGRHGGRGQRSTGRKASEGDGCIGSPSGRRSTPRRPPPSPRARVWRHQLGNLRHAVDEIYATCGEPPPPGAQVSI